LLPSKVIRKGYETVALTLDDGTIVTGLLVEESAETIVVHDPSGNGQSVDVRKSRIDERLAPPQSIMPAGVVNQLTHRQQFLDLAAYVLDIAEHGPSRALELKPDPVLVLPEYEQRLDHAGLIRLWNADSLRRGEEVYLRVCANCHGTHDRPGSLPTSLRFASGRFKNGHDPYALYQTLTRGFGLMVPQTWMVPRQKYDVIHYLREAYLKEHNPSQYAAVDETYLASLPAGDTSGPEPSRLESWVVMDYGPSLLNTYEIGDAATNFAYKGLAVRLDTGPGGVSRGRHWMIWDHDTLRVAAGWSRDGEGEFIDWNGIHFNGRHQIHPRIVGRLHLANPTGPGWARPQTNSFDDDQRVVGRDGRRYGPLPRDWARFLGLYHHGQHTIVSYQIGDTRVLELPGLARLSSIASAAARSSEATNADSRADLVEGQQAPIFLRTMNVDARSQDLVVQIAQETAENLRLVAVSGETAAAAGTIALTAESAGDRDAPAAPADFDGGHYFEVAEADAFELARRDFSITARLNTTHGGTIFCKTSPESAWVPDGQSLFVRGGRLCFDIGWVGVVTSKAKIDDGRWHDVAATWERESGLLRLYVDGRLDQQGTLRAKKPLPDSVVRLGFTAPDFPDPSMFRGQLAEVKFFQRRLEFDEIAAPGGTQSLKGHWKLDTSDEILADLSGGRHAARRVRAAKAALANNQQTLVAGLQPPIDGAEWLFEQGNLRLRLPPGDTRLRFTIWTMRADARAIADIPAQLDLPQPDRDLRPLTLGGPPRWPQRLTTSVQFSSDDGPLAVDVLAHPLDNPWLAQIRPTGLDFLPDGDRMAVCTWDGDVWMVSGLRELPAAIPRSASTGKSPQSVELTWQRIASGLFQPLGLKLVDGRIFVTCRDQLVVLHDLNDDGETDFYENFNNDHQVTDHFHEFAMGLQVDDQGNFYYAKSARHALPAVVPHHGTLLRVAADGSHTEILATGFRAANGVCLNSDGTFIVTDQEGHWNPKNRINWVRSGGFYGNMFGYHDVTDSSDQAMQQPLCWITNAFDRSPAELLWVDSTAWGPLNGSLLNLSYGYGKIFVVPHEQIEAQMQGGLSPLPLPNIPTGLIRGRFHPGDGQLYTCGMFAWAGSATQPGGLYRIRYTGQPIHVPLELEAHRQGMRLKFSGKLDPVAAVDPQHWSVKVWSLKRTANYGSEHYNERRLDVRRVSLAEDRQTVLVECADLQPTWCMELRYNLRGADGTPVEGVIHNTVHQLRDP
jgi:hypothetical protein